MYIGMYMLYMQDERDGIQGAMYFFICYSAIYIMKLVKVLAGSKIIKIIYQSYILKDFYTMNIIAVELRS